MNTQLDIAGLVNQQIQQALKEYLAGIDLKALMEQSMAAAVDMAVQKIASRAAETLLKERDLSAELARITTNQLTAHLDSHAKSAVRTAVSQTDVRKIVQDSVEQQISVKISSYDFPNASIPHTSIDWTGLILSGDSIYGGIMKNFNSAGIQDNSTECQLTLVDGFVVVEGSLVTNNVKSKNVEATDLTVTGNLNLSDISVAAVADIARSVMDDRFSSAWNLGENRIMSDDRLLLSVDALGPSVTNSNLRKLGLLQELRVSGDAKFGETMIVSGKRIGINTEEPAGTLSIWDDDAELTVTKLSRKNMYVGSTRATDVSLGTNNRNQIVLSQDVVSIKDPLELMGIRFSVMLDVPSHAGKPNEIVFVSNAKKDQPRFYICLGGAQWSAMGAVA